MVSTEKAETVIKLTLFALAVGAIFVVNRCNNEKLGEKIKKIDDTENMIFMNMSDCVSKGFSENDCKKSFETAEGLVDKFGIRIRYFWKKDCENVHGECGKCLYAFEGTTF